jgi:hypothetical protein
VVPTVGSTYGIFPYVRARKFNTPIGTLVCSANHDARLAISAIQIRIKQYKFNKHLFWMLQVSISTSDYRQRDPSAGGSYQISKAFQNL